MTVTVAKSAGFCFGVERAVNKVYDALRDNNARNIYTYGPIIHNDEVIRDMEQKGARVVSSVEELKHLPRGTVIIRSHGITGSEMEAIRDAGFEVIDATCPFVKKIHRIVEDYSRKGYQILITGNPDHPEVRGICGWSAGEKPIIISDKKDLDGLDAIKDKPLCLVSQTTFNLKKFKEFVEILSEKGYDVCVLNTICDATEKRQTEARELAAQSEAMIVIGDKNSSNTQKLFEISKKQCENTYYVQTGSDLDYNQLVSINHVGITAGASTPNYIIEEVSKNVRNEL